MGLCGRIGCTLGAMGVLSCEAPARPGAIEAARGLGVLVPDSDGVYDCASFDGGAATCG